MQTKTLHRRVMDGFYKKGILQYAGENVWNLYAVHLDDSIAPEPVTKWTPNGDGEEIKSYKSSSAGISDAEKIGLTEVSVMLNRQ